MHRSEKNARLVTCLDLLVVLIVFIASCLVGKLVIIYVVCCRYVASFQCTDIDGIRHWNVGLEASEEPVA